MRASSANPCARFARLSASDVLDMIASLQRDGRYSLIGLSDLVGPVVMSLMDGTWLQSRLWLENLSETELRSYWAETQFPSTAAATSSWPAMFGVSMHDVGVPAFLALGS